MDNLARIKVELDAIEQQAAHEPKFLDLTLAQALSQYCEQAEWCVDELSRWRVANTIALALSPTTDEDLEIARIDNPEMDLAEPTVRPFHLTISNNFYERIMKTLTLE